MDSQRQPDALADRVERVTRLDRQAQHQLLIGLAIAVLVLLVGPLRFVAQYLSITVHEAGHTVTMWALGMPAFPAFDFRYGGGVSISTTRSLLLLGFLHLVFAGLAWQVHTQRPGDRVALAVVGGAALLHAALAYVPALRHLAISASGHLAEVLVGGIFVYRAISNTEIHEAAERPLYAGLGLFLCGRAAAFGVELLTDARARQLYRAGKGSLVNDLVLIERGLGLGLTTQAVLYALVAFVTPFLAYALFRWQLGGAEEAAEVPA